MIRKSTLVLRCTYIVCLVQTAKQAHLITMCAPGGGEGCYKTCLSPHTMIEAE